MKSDILYEVIEKEIAAQTVQETQDAETARDVRAYENAIADLREEIKSLNTKLDTAISTMSTATAFTESEVNT